MSKKAPTVNVPPAPDPAAVAQAQAEANRINQITPTGSLFFGQLGSTPAPATPGLIPNPDFQPEFITQTTPGGAAPTTDFGALAQQQIIAENANNPRFQLNLAGSLIEQRARELQAAAGPAAPTTSQVANPLFDPNIPEFIPDPNFDPNAPVPGVAGAPPIGSAPPFDVGGGLSLSPDLNRDTALVLETPFQQQLRGRTEAGTLGLADQALGSIAQLPQTPLTTQGLPPLPTSISGAGLPQLPTSIAESALPPLPNAINTAGLPVPAQSLNTGQLPNLQTIDLSALPGLATSQDLQAASAPVEFATFQRGVNLLSPQFEQRDERLQQGFANSGNPIGSEIADEKLRLERQFQNDSLSNLALDAILAGRGEQQRLFNQSLATRQNALGEQLAREGLSAEQRQQLVNEQLATAGLASGLRSQLFGEGLANAGLGQSARGQRLSELLASAGLAQGARGQLVNESLANAGLGSQARQIGFQERLAQRNQQFNELAALLGLSTTPAPGLQNFIPPGQVDVIGAQQLGLNQGNLAAQLAAQQANASRGGLFDLAGALGSAGISTFGPRLF